MHQHVYRDEAITPFEKCKQLLLELALEQRERRPNLDKMVHLKHMIATFPVKTVSAAFDAVVDNHGWLHIIPKEIK